MSQRGSKGYSGGSLARSSARRKVAVSYILRDVEENFNRSGVNSVRIDGANRQLYTAGRDSVIRCWDMDQSGQEFTYRKSLEHHTDWVNDVALCMDGRNIMSASSDTTLKVWDTARGTCSSTLRTHKDYVRCLAYAREREVVASAGLDRAIYIWDVKTLTSLTAANNTITTTTLSGHKESIYSIAINDSGSVLVSGSTEKMLRVWDTRTCEKRMKLKGHTDNVRALVLNRDGTQCLSGSSDGTVRLWSLGQQRCVETFRVHEEGVWSLAVDENFATFYSGGRDSRVLATELSPGGQEGMLLFTEDAPILSLELDPTDNFNSIWVSTTNTCINKWSVDPNSASAFEEEEDGSEEDLGITDVDEPAPIFSKPLATIPGGTSIKEFRIVSNRQQVLTRDNNGSVELWDILHARKEADLGQVDIDDEAERRKTRLYVPNWFSVEVKTGMLSIRLEESECFSAWVMGSSTTLDKATPDVKLNLGALVLKALFENWPSSHQTVSQETSTSSVTTAIPSLPRRPKLEELVEVCGCEVGEWEGLGGCLGVPEAELKLISETNSGDVAKCTEELFKVWLKTAEEVSWEGMSEALVSVKLDKLSATIRDKYCSTADVPVKTEEKSPDKVDLKFFSVPKYTPVVLSEVGDCGTTFMRFLCGDADGNHENRQLNNYCPIWVMDTVCQKKLPDQNKINFSLGKYVAPGEKETGKGSDRLSAHDLLSIKKVQEYSYQKLYGDGGKLNSDGVKIEAGDCIEIFCMDQVLDTDLDLRTVKYTLWRGGGDMKLLHHVIEPTKNDAEDKSNTVNVY